MSKIISSTEDDMVMNGMLKVASINLKDNVSSIRDSMVSAMSDGYIKVQSLVGN